MHTPQMEVKSVANVSFHRLQVSSAGARSIPTAHRNKLDVPWELRRGNDTTSCTVVRRIQHPRQGCGGTKTAPRDSHAQRRMAQRVEQLPHPTTILRGLRSQDPHPVQRVITTESQYDPVQHTNQAQRFRCSDDLLDRLHVLHADQFLVQATIKIG